MFERPLKANEEEIYTASGFVFYSDNSDKTYDLIREIHELCQKGVNDNAITNDYEYCMEVIRNFKMLIPNFYLWLNNCEKGGYLYGRRLDFVKDILKFIKTGTRTVSVMNWKTLLIDDVDYPLNKKNSMDNTLDKVIREKGLKTPQLKTSEIISLWCSRDSGFSDMLWTLNILTELDYDSIDNGPTNSSSFSLSIK